VPVHLQPGDRADQRLDEPPRMARPSAVVLRAAVVEARDADPGAVGDRQLYEAADIEGASGWQKFRYVTWPSITPVVFFSLVTGVIYGFQFFTQAYVSSITVAGVTTTQAATSVGSPNRSLLFYSVYLWQQGWGNFRMGYASALAWMLFMVTMVCTILLVKTSKRWVHYAGGGFR